ncbi:MAG: hypothetical protein DMD43_03525 [Gemmatimonadetes bacterium]|nr:MAG: hypothetical protein DMD43_03525 [Gemmatimonadota bacterium]
MPGRGRRVAVALIVLALVLSAGRWGSDFLTERLWEASVSEAVATAGARRALLALALELSVLLLAVAWLVGHVVVAARIALPDYPPPDREHAQVWPAKLPRWTLTAGAVVLGALVGGGADRWLDHLLLAASGARLGVRDPLVGADLGRFVGAVPLWLEMQSRAAVLAAAGLGCVVLLHLAGGTIRTEGRRLVVSPRVRGHVAILLAGLALALAWGSSLEPFRLATGSRGPLLSSEYLLRTLVAEVQAGIGAAAALAGLLWWGRLRGSAVVGVWILFGVALLAGRVLPLHTEAAIADPTWRAAARGLDSVAFALGGVKAGPPPVRTPAASLTPSLWDAPMLAAGAADSSALSGPRRGWIAPGGSPHPVWFAVRVARGEPPALLALSDDQVSPTGGLLSWREGDSAPAPGVNSYLELSPHNLRPAAPEIDLADEARGVQLGGWVKRLVLAWALQYPRALSASPGARLAWRLDPAVRLAAVAPFAHWSPPTPRLLQSGLVWESDGLLLGGFFPASARIPWGGATISMVRPALLGVVNARTGGVRIFRDDPADSLAAAWARITDPLIEPPSAVPAELRSFRSYPDELLLAQARALEGPAWHAGRLDRSGGDSGEAMPPAAPGGAEAVVPLLDDGSREVRALLLARRTAAGDSVRLVEVDSVLAPESAAALAASWDRFPFRQAIHDSVSAAGARIEKGRVRFALASDGVVAYQPVWSVSPAGRAQLVLVSVALGRKAGVGRTMAEAWRNLRGEASPTAAGSHAEAVLEAARRLMRHADSALKRGDLQELGRALANLKDLLEPSRPKP